MTLIIKPLVTEKMTRITEKSSVERTRKFRGETQTYKLLPKYGFIVSPDADKIQIKKEVEAMYKVDVVAVNTCRYAGKRVSRYTRAGMVRGHKSAYKKAIVTLKEGQSIDFYSNI